MWVRSRLVISGFHIWLLSGATKADDCPEEAMSLTVSTPAEAYELAQALRCSGLAHIHVDWNGRIELENSLALGNGSSLNITGSDGAIIDGADEVQLLTVNDGATLHMHNITLQQGRTIAYGGGVFANDSSLIFNDCIFTGNIATYGGESYGAFNA